MKIADFGIAKLAAGTADPSPSSATWSDPALTQAGAALGTPSYMAPEQRDHPGGRPSRRHLLARRRLLRTADRRVADGEIPPPPPPPRSMPASMSSSSAPSKKTVRSGQQSARDMKTQVEDVTLSAARLPGGGMPQNPGATASAGVARSAGQGVVPTAARWSGRAVTGAVLTGLSFLPAVIGPLVLGLLLPVAVSHGHGGASKSRRDAGGPGGRQAWRPPSSWGCSARSSAGWASGKCGRRGNEERARAGHVCSPDVAAGVGGSAGSTGDRTAGDRAVGPSWNVRPAGPRAFCVVILVIIVGTGLFAIARTRRWLIGPTSAVGASGSSSSQRVRLRAGGGGGFVHCVVRFVQLLLPIVPRVATVTKTDSLAVAIPAAVAGSPTRCSGRPRGAGGPGAACRSCCSCPPRTATGPDLNQFGMATPDTTFAATRWTLVQRTRGDSAESGEALSELCAAYYTPVLVFLQRSGLGGDEARSDPLVLREDPRRRRPELRRQDQGPLPQLPARRGEATSWAISATTTAGKKRGGDFRHEPLLNSSGKPQHPASGRRMTGPCRRTPGGPRWPGGPPFSGSRLGGGRGGGARFRGVRLMWGGREKELVEFQDEVPRHDRRRLLDCARASPLSTRVAAPKERQGFLFTEVSRQSCDSHSSPGPSAFTVRHYRTVRTLFSRTRSCGADHDAAGTFHSARGCARSRVRADRDCRADRRRDSPPHCGGGVVWDREGNLLLGIGDNTPPQEVPSIHPDEVLKDARRSAANMQDLRGKILRITPKPDGAIPCRRATSSPRPLRGVRKFTSWARGTHFGSPWIRRRAGWSGAMSAGTSM